MSANKPQQIVISRMPKTLRRRFILGVILLLSGVVIFLHAAFTIVAGSEAWVQDLQLSDNFFQIGKIHGVVHGLWLMLVAGAVIAYAGFLLIVFRDA